MSVSPTPVECGVVVWCLGTRSCGFTSVVSGQGVGVGSGPLFRTREHTLERSKENHGVSVDVETYGPLIYFVLKERMSFNDGQDLGRPLMMMTTDLCYQKGQYILE